MRPSPALQRIPDIAQGECVQLGLTVNSQTNNNTLIITAEQAEVIQKRNTAMDEEVAQLGEAYLAKRGLAERDKRGSDSRGGNHAGRERRHSFTAADRAAAQRVGHVIPW